MGSISSLRRGKKSPYVHLSVLDIKLRVGGGGSAQGGCKEMKEGAGEVVCACRLGRGGL